MSRSKRVGATSKKTHLLGKAQRANQIDEAALSAVLRRKAASYLNVPGVNSVGVARELRKGRPTGNLAIRFTVDRKLSKKLLGSRAAFVLPEYINVGNGLRIPVDVVERSFRISNGPPSSGADPGLAARHSRRDPIQPGISVSNRREHSGTIGAIVRDNTTGDQLILTCWHVLRGRHGLEGDPIAQPGLDEDANTDANTMGSFLRGFVGPRGDCAVGSIVGRGVQTDVLGIGMGPTQTLAASLDTRVMKSGKTTGVTFGIVTAVGMIMPIDYPHHGREEIECFEVMADPQRLPAGGALCDVGDSGSLWMQADSAIPGTHGMGLHFAYNDEPGSMNDFALACPIDSVFSVLGVSF